MTEEARNRQLQRPQVNIKFGSSEEERQIYAWLTTRPGGITAYIRKLIVADMAWEKARKEYEEGR